MKLARRPFFTVALAAALATLGAPASAQKMSKYVHLAAPLNAEVHAKADGAVPFEFAIDWAGLHERFPGKTLFVALGAAPLGVNSVVAGDTLVEGQTTAFLDVAPLLQSLADHGRDLTTPIVWHVAARPKHTPGDPIVEPELSEAVFRLVLDGVVTLPKASSATVTTAATPAAEPAVASAELLVPKVDATPGSKARLGARLALSGKPQAGYVVSFVIGGGQVATAKTGADGTASADWTVPGGLAGKATSIRADVAKGPQGVAVTGKGLLVVAERPKPLAAPVTQARP